MGIVVYVTTVTSNLEIKKHQQKIEMVLSGKKIEYETVDIASSEDGKTKMRQLAGEKSLPPQICNGDQYCGDYGAFENAVEDEELEAFLKI